jgi:hypothetical protein
MASEISQNPLSLFNTIPPKLKERWNRLPPSAVYAISGAALAGVGLYFSYRLLVAESAQNATLMTSIPSNKAPAGTSVLSGSSDKSKALSAAPTGNPVLSSVPVTTSPVSSCVAPTVSHAPTSAGHPNQSVNQIHTPPTAPYIRPAASSVQKPVFKPAPKVEEPKRRYPYNRANIELLIRDTRKEEIRVPIPGMHGQCSITSEAIILGVTHITDTQNNLIPIYIKRTSHSSGHSTLSVHDFGSRDTLASATYRYFRTYDENTREKVMQLYGEGEKADVFNFHFECTENHKIVAETWLKALIQYSPKYKGRVLVSLRHSDQSREKEVLLNIGFADTEASDQEQPTWSMLYLPKEKWQDLLKEAEEHPIKSPE